MLEICNRNLIVRAVLLSLRMLFISRMDGASVMVSTNDYKDDDDDDVNSAIV